MKYALIELSSNGIEYDSTPTHVLVEMNPDHIAKLDKLITFLVQNAINQEIPIVYATETSNNFAYKLLEEEDDGSYTVKTPDDYQHQLDESLLRIVGDNIDVILVNANEGSQTCFGTIPNNKEWVELNEADSKALTGGSKVLTLDTFQ